MLSKHVESVVKACGNVAKGRETVAKARGNVKTRGNVVKACGNAVKARGNVKTRGNRCQSMWQINPQKH